MPVERPAISPERPKTDARHEIKPVATPAAPSETETMTKTETPRFGLSLIDDQEQQWTKRVSDLLLNKRILEVAFMTEAEMRDHGWNHRAVMLRLSSGEWIYPSQDDEGNGAGSLFTTSEQCSTIPAL